MGAILAKKIYENEQLVFNSPGGLSVITSEQVNATPKQAWLVKNKFCCGGDEEWQLEFQQPTSFINVLTGVWIQQGQTGFLIDGNVADVAAKLNACCGSNATVTQNYGSGLPAYQAPVLKTFTLVRTDDGTIAAAVDAELAYGGNSTIYPNSFTRVSASGGNTTYTFQAYEVPHAQGTDTITQTARVFSSNNYGTSLAGSNVYALTYTIDGVSAEFKAGTTLGAMVTALQADATLGGYGTWSTASTHITLTTTVKDVAVLVLGQDAP